MADHLSYHKSLREILAGGSQKRVFRNGAGNKRVANDMCCYIYLHQILPIFQRRQGLELLVRNNRTIMDEHLFRVFCAVY